MNFSTIGFKVEDERAYISLGENAEKSLTTFSEKSLLELKDIIVQVEQLAKEKKIKSMIVHSVKKDCFLAGMDVSVINSLDSFDRAQEGSKAGQDIFNRIEDLPIDTIACIDGVCVGGGLEFALSCRYIFVSDNPKTRLGLPEVKLGVLPGFGGTYRLPRRVGTPNALDLMLTGKMIKAQKAQRMGLADLVTGKECLLAAALNPQRFKKKKSFSQKLSSFVQHLGFVQKIIFNKAKEKVVETTKGFYPAPLKIIELMELNQKSFRKSSLLREAKSFAELSQTIQSKSLQNIFFIHDNAKKAFKDEVAPIERSAVLGAGTMGGGIAWLLAKNGEHPYMKDISEEGLNLGLQQAAKNFGAALKRKKITRDQFLRSMHSILPTLNYDGFKSVDMVVEAVVENMDVKKKVFAELESNVREDCIITSNTSSLSVGEMSTALQKPERFVGLHFFNPVHKMPLVEIITHEKTSLEATARLFQWVLKSNKVPVVVKDGPGFLVNRILLPFLNEASYLLHEGVDLNLIEEAALQFGMPMGPFRLMDEIGIDVVIKAGKILEDGLGKRVATCPLVHQLKDFGLLGKKDNKGFYIYDEKGKVLELNPLIKEKYRSRKTLDETTIQMRMILPMINEAARILDEGLVDSAATVDLALVFGIGFPPFRGGLLKYADREGLSRLTEVLVGFSQDIDELRFYPCDYLEKLSIEKKSFYSGN